MLGIASGVTPENAYQYFPYVDAILLATGISRSFHELDNDKMAKLKQALQDYESLKPKE